MSDDRVVPLPPRYASEEEMREAHDLKVLTALVEGGGDFDLTCIAGPAWCDIDIEHARASLERLEARDLAQQSFEHGSHHDWIAWHPTSKAFEELNR